jgi:hemerythrin-like domain-containing protein
VPERRTLRGALEHEHREIDGAIEEFLAGADQPAAIDALRRALAALRRHIYLEEEFLFPPMRDAGFVAPIFVMLREHGELWRTMDGIERVAGREAPEVAAGCRELLAQLEKHNAKEEPILYTRADDVLGAPAGGELLAFLAGGRMPEGWVCARAAG